mmetsp:Transcript_4169/g.10622  ORF Transcript_4169/g.10622 Transcript_4169/m.10622 type:complete len:298 (-) Transcript_4169:740-1633(-)
MRSGRPLLALLLFGRAVGERVVLLAALLLALLLVLLELRPLALTLLLVLALHARLALLRLAPLGRLPVAFLLALELLEELRLPRPLLHQTRLLVLLVECLCLRRRSTCRVNRRRLLTQLLRDGQRTRLVVGPSRLRVIVALAEGGAQLGALQGVRLGMRVGDQVQLAPVGHGGGGGAATGGARALAACAGESGEEARGQLHLSGSCAQCVGQRPVVAARGSGRAVERQRQVVPERRAARVRVQGPGEGALALEEHVGPVLRVRQLQREGQLTLRGGGGGVRHRGGVSQAVLVQLDRQ